MAARERHVPRAATHLEFDVLLAKPRWVCAATRQVQIAEALYSAASSVAVSSSSVSTMGLPCMLLARRALGTRSLTALPVRP